MPRVGPVQHGEKCQISSQISSAVEIVASLHDTACACRVCGPMPACVRHVYTASPLCTSTFRQQRTTRRAPLRRRAESIVLLNPRYKRRLRRHPSAASTPALSHCPRSTASLHSALTLLGLGSWVCWRGSFALFSGAGRSRFGVWHSSRPSGRGHASPARRYLNAGIPHSERR